MNGHYLYSNFIALNTTFKLFISSVRVVDKFGERFEAFACTCIAGKAWNRSEYFSQVVKVSYVAFTIFFTKNALEEASTVAEGKKKCGNSARLEEFGIFSTFALPCSHGVVARVGEFIFTYITKPRQCVGANELWFTGVGKCAEQHEPVHGSL